MIDIDKIYLERIETFAKVRINFYKEKYALNSTHPRGFRYFFLAKDIHADLSEILNIMNSYHNQNVNISTDAVDKLKRKKKEQKERAKKSKLEKELLEWNICPKCASNLICEMKKWYKIFSHDIIKTCPKCGIVEKRNFHRDTKPFGLR